MSRHGHLLGDRWSRRPGGLQACRLASARDPSREWRPRATGGRAPGCVRVAVSRAARTCRSTTCDAPRRVGLLASEMPVAVALAPSRWLMRSLAISRSFVEGLPGRLPRRRQRGRRPALRPRQTVMSEAASIAAQGVGAEAGRKASFFSRAGPADASCRRARPCRPRVGSCSR